MLGVGKIFMSKNAEDVSVSFIFAAAMLKYCTAILFLVSFVMMSFSKNLVMLDFYVNRDAIAAKYCINKYKPQMHCNGHCFLMRQLKKEQQQETKNLGEQFGKIEVVSSQSFFPRVENQTYVSIVVRKFIDSYHCLYTKDISLLVFKPPRA